MSCSNTGEYPSGQRTQIHISPHDPLIVRDARPFSIGEGANHARAVAWPYPSTIAGAIRTLVGKSTAKPASDPFLPDNLQTLKAIQIWGPLPYADNSLYVPSPRDLLADLSGTHVSLRPKALSEGEGCDLPNDLWPVHVPCNEKPGQSPAFWPMSAVVRWLSADIRDAFGPIDNGLASLPKDERIHVKIDPATSTAEESCLFSTEGLVIPDANHIPTEEPLRPTSGIACRATQLAVLVSSEDTKLSESIKAIKQLHPLGGERRLSMFEKTSFSPCWECPSTVKEALRTTTGVRMLLATPAVFSAGWLPGWLDPATLTGVPPGIPNLRLRLRGACVGRWEPLSGWSLEKRPDGSGKAIGPKPMKRMVPAGSVYFFEVIDGSPETLADIWLHPVSDCSQDVNDGFGLALWGVWDIDNSKGGSNR